METKLKFKVGDKVRVKSLKWYDSEKKSNGNIMKGRIFTDDMIEYCGQILTIEAVCGDYYEVEGNSKYWQDWMLEDEAVTEEKQEVMKTKVMTKKHAQDVVRCTKYRLKNEEESSNLQKKLFEIGCQWNSGEESVKNEDYKYLFVGVNLNITTANSEETFIKNKFTELKIDDVLNIKLEDMKKETKEMTKEEVLEFLGSTKILCTSTEETAKVQEKLFELGIVWMYDGQNVREDKYLLFINQKGNICYCSDIEFWINDVNKRIEPSEILAIQIKEEKPKFDPKNLQAFDKVLVRDNEGDRWRGNLFCHIKEELGYNYFCIYDNWKYCIPYNEDTKHLHGTAEEAPEFYRI